MVLATLSCALLLAQTLEEERAIALVRRTLAAELRVHEEGVTLSGVQPVEWSSARLGCDDAGDSDLRKPAPPH